MANKLIITISSLLLVFTLNAANLITGKVMDETSRQPIDFANVSLFRQGETTPLAGTTTDENGKFSLSGMKNGKYVLKVSFLGYDEANKDVTLAGKEVNVGTIYLSEQTQALNEVEVVGQGSSMRFELDKKVFTVDQSIAAAGGSVTDALENIPSVDVDQEGNISLRNSDAVEVWINGKPAGLSAENRAQVLEQMPAESIKEIEVITNPSAKFSPEGTAGIINLVLKKDRKAGFYGSVNARVNYALAKPWNVPPGGNLGLNFNFTKGIVDGYFNVGYHYHSSNGANYNDRYNYLTQGGDTTSISRLIKDGKSYRSGGGMFLRGGLNFRVTDRSTIGVSGFGMITAKDDKTNGFFSSKSNSPTSYTLYDVTDYHAPQDTTNIERLSREYTRDENGTGSHPGWNAMVDWTFDISKQHRLMMSAQMFNFGFNSDNYYIQKENGLKSVQEQSNENDDKMVQLKADYEWKPTMQSRLEAGWQTDLAWRSTLAEAWNCDSLSNRLGDIKNYYNNFHNNEQTHALYITYGNRFWNKFSVQVGLRGEYFRRHIESEYYDRDGKIQTSAQDTSYFQLFPSVYLGYDFGNGNELQANYTRRINRPRGHQINPRQDFSDSTNIRYGNPNLMPQYSSSVELNYLKNWERHTLSAGLFYRFADDVTQNVKYMDGNLMRNTFINLGKRHEAGAELVVKNRLFGEVLMLTTSANFYYNRMDEATYIPSINGVALEQITIPEQNIFAGSVRLTAQFMFTKTFTGQLSGNYRSPRVVAQGTSSHSYSIDIGLKKTFLDRKLALALNVRDLLNSRARRNTTWGDGFWQYTDNRWNSRMISLNITYNFGNMQSKKPQRPDDQSAMESSMDMSGEGEEF
ncbi:MAG: TonB-dependent receptor [Paludibacteraceae bacterium]|nr:TonB-dependent receptor [Paludibacteraceae bacterium]